MPGLFETTFDELDLTLASYTSDVLVAVISDITPVVSTLLLIYIMLWGWMTIRGQINEFAVDGFTRIVRLTIIVALALNIGHYNNFIGDFLSALPDHLLGITANGASTTTGEYLDNTFVEIWYAGWVFISQANIESSLGVPDIPLSLAGLAIWALGIFLTFFAAFLIILSKMALAVLVGVGPIFVILTMFEATKRFFDAWLGQCFNFIVISLLTGGVLRLIVSILVSYLLDYKSASVPVPVVADTVPILGFSLFGIFILKQVLPISSALGGGISLSTLGAGRAVGGAVKGKLNQLDNRRTERLSKLENSKERSSYQQSKSIASAPVRAAQALANRMSSGNSIARKN